LLIISLDNH